MENEIKERLNAIMEEIADGRMTLYSVYANIKKLHNEIDNQIKKAM